MATTNDPAAAASQDLAHITLVNQSSSPLLRLPAELRNRIYTFTFNNEIVRVVPSRLREPSGHENKFTGPVALLLTSRQLYAETSDLFVRTCIFDVSQSDSRREVLDTLEIKRCKKMEAVMLTRHAIYRMKGTAWSPEKSGIASGAEKCFGALRWVCVQNHSLYSDYDMLVKIRFDSIFGPHAFALVYDDRAGN